MTMRCLHIVIPHFNEPGTLKPCLERVIAAPLPDGWTRSLIIVDDGSEHEAADSAADVVLNLARADGAPPVRLVHHDANRGKGAALQTGFDVILKDSATKDDDVVIIQDADLEYDPNDYDALLAPLLTGETDAVLGTRWGAHRELSGILSRVHAFGNHALTWVSNRTTGFAVSDMECCYKLIPVESLRHVRPMLSEPRFGIEPQMVAAFARLGFRVNEVPVSYDPRGFSDGKKIGMRDGLRAFWVIARERLRGGKKRSEKHAGQAG